MLERGVHNTWFAEPPRNRNQFKLGWRRTQSTIVDNGVVCQTRDELFVAKRDQIFAAGAIANSIPSG